jgi:hypothetical protein
MSNTFIVQFLKTYADHTHALANLIDHYSGAYVDSDYPRNASPTANILADAGYQVRRDNARSDCQAGDEFGEALSLAAKINRMNNKFRGSSDDIVKQATDMLTGGASPSAGADDGYIEDIGLGEHHASSRIKRDCEMNIRDEFSDLMHIESIMSQIDLAGVHAVNDLDREGLSPLKNPTEYKKRLMDLMMHRLADTLEDAREQIKLTEEARAKSGQPERNPEPEPEPESEPEPEPESSMEDKSIVSGSLSEETPA